MLHSLLIMMVLGAVYWLLMKQASMAVWSISYAMFAFLVMKYGSPGLLVQAGLWLGFALFLIGLIRPLRQVLLTRPLFRVARRAMPAMSATEREALEAGTIGWEGDLFSGAPDFS